MKVESLAVQVCTRIVAVVTSGVPCVMPSPFWIDASLAAAFARGRSHGAAQGSPCRDLGRPRRGSDSLLDFPLSQKHKGVRVISSTCGEDVI